MHYTQLTLQSVQKKDTPKTMGSNVLWTSNLERNLNTYDQKRSKTFKQYVSLLLYINQVSVLRNVHESCKRALSRQESLQQRYMFTVTSAADFLRSFDSLQASLDASGVLECGYFVAVFTLRCAMSGASCWHHQPGAPSCWRSSRCFPHLLSVPVPF